MSSITVRNLDDSVKAALRQRAARHGWSMEQEVREILRRSVQDQHPQGVSFADRVNQRFRGLDANDLPTAHRITELVEEHLEARFGPVRCTIHLEPREYAIADITFRGTHG
jgi:plasmid stability protein